jgi:hypothetical protein
MIDLSELQERDAEEARAFLPYADLRRAAVARYRPLDVSERTFSRRLSSLAMISESATRSMIRSSVTRQRGKGHCDQEAASAWMSAERGQQIHSGQPCCLCAAACLEICEACVGMSVIVAQRWAEDFINAIERKNNGIDDID